MPAANPLNALLFSNYVDSYLSTLNTQLSDAETRNDPGSAFAAPSPIRTS
jgi:hypothetical protein